MKKSINERGGELLPVSLPSEVRRERLTTTRFGGSASLDGSGEGVITSMLGMSPHRVPFLATRKEHRTVGTASPRGTPHGMVRFGDSVILVKGSTLYSLDGGLPPLRALGTVSEGDKEFFVFGNRLYIFPDKLYVEAGSDMLYPMEIDSGVIKASDFNGQTITLPEGYKWSDWGFAVGDCLHIVNEDDPNPAPEGYYHLIDVRGRVAVCHSTFFTTDKCDARFRREIPSFSAVCTSGSRVYGIVGGALYASAEGSPMDFYSRNMADGKGPAVLYSDSQGDFTACIPWQDYVIAFKRDGICKLLGTRADTFALQETSAVGIPPELARSLSEVQGSLYYVSDSGVYRYRGQQPERVSPPPEAQVVSAVGGTDGVAYYVALMHTVGSLYAVVYVYRPDLGEWYALDERSVSDMMQKDGFLWMQDGAGEIRVLSSDGREAVYASDSITVMAFAVLRPDRFEGELCRPIELCIRAKGRMNASMIATLTYVGGESDGEMLSHYLSGDETERVYRLKLSPRVCDWTSLRLTFIGEWEIYAITRVYEHFAGA